MQGTAPLHSGGRCIILTQGQETAFGQGAAGKTSDSQLTTSSGPGRNCRARSGISLHWWVGRGRELCKGLQNPCQTNLPWIPHQTPSWKYRPSSEKRVPVSPRHCSMASSVKTARQQLYSSLQRNYNLQEETFASPEPHILLWQSSAVPAQPEVGDRDTLQHL